MTTDYKDNCLGYYFRFLTGEEDCLFLNVAVPERNSGGAPLPVVFWIHGGAFIHGGEGTPLLYHPGAFTDKGVIFVSVNYRLGPLGKCLLFYMNQIIGHLYSYENIIL
jgi:carboxylesterase type B